MGQDGAFGNSHARGQVRASCFDISIAARRIENVSKSALDIGPENRAKLQSISARLRALTAETALLLPAADKRDLQKVFD